MYIAVGMPTRFFSWSDPGFNTCYYRGFVFWVFAYCIILRGKPGEEKYPGFFYLYVNRNTVIMKKYDFWELADRVGVGFVYLFSLFMLAFGITGLVLGSFTSMDFVKADFWVMIIGGGIGTILSFIYYLDRYAGPPED